MDDAFPNITAGDLVPDGSRILVSEDEHRRVWWVREGDKIQPYIEPLSLQGMLDANAEAAANYNATGSTESFTRVASIPSYLYWHLWNEGRLQDPKDLARFLNDGDNAKLRTTGHRL